MAVTRSEIVSVDRIRQAAERIRGVAVRTPLLPWEDGVWLKPELVAQIEYAEWTPDGHLRHSKFVGLREDKKASKVVRER